MARFWALVVLLCGVLALALVPSKHDGCHDPIVRKEWYFHVLLVVALPIVE